MTIRKRIGFYMSCCFLLSFLFGAVLLYLGIKNSPELYDKVQMSRNTFVEPITAMGFKQIEYGSEHFRKEDPYGNEHSSVSISYDARGNLESYRFELAYVNTSTAYEVYHDMEILAGLAGFSLEQDKEAIQEVIEKIRQDQSSRAEGSIEGGGWSIGTNVYKNRENKGERLRYILCTVWKKWNGS